MKRIITSLLVFMFCISVVSPVFAEEVSDDADVYAGEPQSLSSQTEEETQNASQPRLMVSEYKCGVLTPAEDGTVEISFKNYSAQKAVFNIKLSVLDESGDIRASGIGTKYVDKIKAGGTYTWSLPVTVAKTAASGEHKLSVTAEYEDEYFSAYSSADTLAVTVAQSVGLDYDGLILPPKVTQGETASISVSFMNTGKSVIRNCKVQFAIDGLQTGGVLFAGEIPAGESKEGTANFSVSKEALGETSGTAVLSYEDELGGQYSQTVDLSTVIEEPPPEKTEETEKESKYPLWWLFLIAGLIGGGAIGFIIPTAIHERRQRLEDEKRL